MKASPRYQERAVSDSKIVVFPKKKQFPSDDRQIVKYRPRPEIDPFLWSMFLMYARAPKAAAPSPDGFFSLGEIGTAPEKDWTRMTPYSIARREPEGCKCGVPGCVGHEVVEEQVQFPGFTSEAVMLKSPHELWLFDVPANEAFYESGEVPPAELAAHPGPFRVRWLPRG